MGCLKLTYRGAEGLERSAIFLRESLDKKEVTVKKRYDYYPFGLSFNEYQRSSTLPNNFKYNGFEEQVDWGVYDYQSRYYDPTLGRFLNVDPAADLMRRFSTYSYAFDNPIRYIDPDGMMPEDKVNNCPNCPSPQAAANEVAVKLEKIYNTVADNVNSTIDAVANFIKSDPSAKSGDIDKTITSGSEPDQRAGEVLVSESGGAGAMENDTRAGIITGQINEDLISLGAKGSKISNSDPSISVAKAFKSALGAISAFFGGGHSKIKSSNTTNSDSKQRIVRTKSREIIHNAGNVKDSTVDHYYQGDFVRITSPNGKVTLTTGYKLMKERN